MITLSIAVNKLRINIIDLSLVSFNPITIDKHSNFAITTFIVDDSKEMKTSIGCRVLGTAPSEVMQRKNINL